MTSVFQSGSGFRKGGLDPGRCLGIWPSEPGHAIFIFLKPAMSYDFALSPPAPSVAVSIGLITHNVGQCQAPSGRRPETIAQLIETSGLILWRVGLLRRAVAASSS